MFFESASRGLIGEEGGPLDSFGLRIVLRFANEKSDFGFSGIELFPTVFAVHLRR